MAKTVGIVLSGCGMRDGTEIHEAVCAILACHRAGARTVYVAPDIPQRLVFDHARGQPAEGEQRGVLAESGRIARGEIQNAKDVHAKDFDALVFPGGYGAALNLSDFGIAGEKLTVNQDVARLVGEMLDAKKPVGFLCIAPPIIAKLLGDRGVRGAKVTIGNDPGVAGKIAALGQTHVECTARECVVDEERKVATGPAYMVATNVAELYEGIEKLVNAVLRLA